MEVNHVTLRAITRKDSIWPYGVDAALLGHRKLKAEVKSEHQQFEPVS